MADLIQIGIDVRTNIKQATADLDKMGGSVVNNIRTIDRLESEVKQLNSALSKGSATEAAYAKGMRQINNELSLFQQRATKAAQIEKKFGSAAASGGKSMNRFNVALQQGGFQLQDFAVQLQSGTSFFTAFGQQGSQFAGIFGPGGAVIGAVIAIGSAIGGIAAKSFMASRSVKEFGEQLEETSSVMEDYISLASKSDDVFASLFKSSKTALSQTSQAAKDLLLIAKTEALDSIRGLGKSLADTSTEAGFWAKVMLNTDRTVTGNLLNIDTQLKGNITAWKNTGKEVQSFIDAVREIGTADSIDGMYQSALKARDIFKQTVDVTGEMTEDQKSFWKELSTTILNLETMGATVEAMNGSWSDTSEAIDAATASMKLFYEYAERDAEAQDKRTAAVDKIEDALANTLLIESRRVEIAQAGANLDEVLAKHAREDFILKKKSENIVGNNLAIALEAYDNAVAALQVESDRNATLSQRATAEKAAAAANAAYDKAAAAADAKAKAEAQKLLELQIKISATPAYEPMSALAVEAAKSQAEMIKIFETTAALKEELGESAFEALRLAGVDMASPIDAAAKAAARLAADLNISLAAALEMRRMASDEEAVMSQGVVTGSVTDRFGVSDLLNMGYTKEYLIAIGKMTDETKKLKDGMTDAERAAEELRKELERPMVNAIESVSNAFGDFIADGLRDFKSFASSIVNSFKSMIAQMIATAARNKIMLSLGMGGTAFAEQAVAGNVAGIGGNAAFGPIGSFMGSFAGGGAAGTGVLGGLGSVFGTGGMGLGGSFGSLGTLLSGGSSVAAGGTGFAATLGAAIPAIAAVAVVIGLLSKKTKLLDSGLRTTVEGFDIAIETFKKTQSSRLFGLLKGSKVTAYESASAEVADPLIEAIGNMQQSIVDAAGTLGIGANAFDDFSYQFKLSLKGLTEEEQLQKINEEITKMGDSFASLTGHFETMNELLEAATQRMQLQNRLDQLLGNNQAILTRQREAELKAMHELNRPLAQAIYDLEDANAAVANSFAALRASIDLEKTRVQDSFASLLDGLKERLDVVNETMQQSRNIYDMLANAVSGRSVTSGLGQAFARREGALSFIRGGDFSDEKKLREALDVVAEPTEDLFGSFVDYARDFARTSITLEEAKKVAQVQLTADEKQVLLLKEQIVSAEANRDAQLDALDQQYQMMVDQYNALLGIDTSVKSVSDAIATLGSAISGLAAAQAAAKAAAAVPAGASAVMTEAQKVSAARSSLGGSISSSSNAYEKHMKGEADLLKSAASVGVNISGKTGVEIMREISSKLGSGTHLSLDNETATKQFAMGGYHTGGLRMVGERGPELEATGPSRIFSHNQTSGMFRDPDLKDAVRSLKEEVSGLRSEQRQIQMGISKYIKRGYDIERKWDVDGLPATRT